MNVYLLNLEYLDFKDQKFAGIYTTEEKAKEAAQILVNKYCEWRNIRSQKLHNDVNFLYYDKPVIIDWNNPKDQQFYKIHKIVLDDTNFNPSDFFDMF